MDDQPQPAAAPDPSQAPTAPGQAVPGQADPRGAGLGETQAEQPHTDDIASGEGCLLALRFAEPLMAQEALLAALRLRSKNHLQMGDAAIVGKESSGRITIQQTRDLNAVQGASGGLWMGVLVGLFVPGGVLIAGALGAAIGGLWAKLRDIGISDSRMKELGDQLREGEVALFMLISDAHRYHAMRELRRFPATVLYSTLSDDDTARVTEALAVAAAAQ